MYMAEELDAGDMILSKATPIGPEETAGELTLRLGVLGAGLLSETLSLIAAGNAPRTPQKGDFATFAPPIEKSMAKLDFSIPPANFCNLVRGLNPAPGAHVTLDGQPLKIHKAVPAPDFRGEPGEILDKKRLIAACQEGAVELLTVQPQGKKPMDGAAYLNGLRRYTP